MRNQQQAYSPQHTRRTHHCRPTLYDAIEAALSDQPGWVEVARMAMEGRGR